MKKIALFAVLFFSVVSIAFADNQKPTDTDFDREIAAKMVDLSVQRFKIAEDVTIDDAIDSMKLSVETPLRRSFQPNSTNTRSGVWGSTSLPIRRRPPAAVSPG